jgi:DNA-binding response OmpR family regulator
VSSKDQETDKYWALKKGADSYLTKPFTSDQLAQAIEAQLVPKE